LIAGLLAVTLTSPVAVAQERAAFSKEELDQMLAPIALYPDSLLSQILMASTYPLEVVQAARWSRANSQLKGDDAVKAVEGKDWDPSVKSLVAFPQILHRMDERLDWTQRLGEAFLAQEPHVLDAIQGLRQRAAAAGNLNSNEQMRVTQQNEAILIEPARPEAVYVPYYNPAVVYAPWAWTGYPPVYWAPFPGYYPAPAFAPGFFWGPAIVVSTGFFFGHCNWHHRHVTVVNKTVVTQTSVGRPVTTVTPHAKPVAWKHDPAHRKGVPYRQASLRDQYGGRTGPGMHGGDGRRDSRGPGPSAPEAHPGNGRSDDRRDFADRGGREAAQRPSAQGGTHAPGKPNFDSGSRQPGTAGPSAPGNERRSERGRDTDRFRERSFASRNAPAPAAREARRPDSSGNNSVLRFPTPQAGPSAATVRQDPRPAVPQRSAQPGNFRPQPQQARPPQTASSGGPAPRPAVMPQRMAPPPQAQVRGDSAPRVASGSGNFGTGGGGRNRGGGGSFR
jgi:uncharacterized protein DUF3300